VRTSADLDEYREESLAGWNEAAPAWGQRQEWLFEQTRPVTEWLLERLGPSAGQAILELAAGPGEIGLRIAARVEPGGCVISSDFSPEMVGVARRNGAARGVTNVEYRVLDAERLDLPDGSVDGAICRWGFMLMADPGAALRETRRALRPGGRLAFAVWSEPERNPWTAVPMAAAVELGFAEPPDPAQPGPFSLGNPDLLHDFVRRSGFSDPEIEEIAFAFRYRDLSEFWEVLAGLSARFARALASHSKSERAELRVALAERLQPFRDADGSYSIPASSWGVRVTR
jgi:SAM-dependent methyltransferase